MNKPKLLTKKECLARALEYIFETEREDFEEQCAEHGYTYPQGIENLPHVYAFASKAWELTQ